MIVAKTMNMSRLFQPSFVYALGPDLNVYAIIFRHISSAKMTMKKISANSTNVASAVFALGPVRVALGREQTRRKR